MLRILRDFWEYIADENNRSRLAFVGAIVAAIAASLWAIYTHNPPKSVENTRTSIENTPIAIDTGYISTDNPSMSGEPKHLSELRECIQGNKPACVYFIIFANQAVTYCESKYSNQTGFELAILKKKCIEDGKKIKALADLLKNHADNCNVTNETSPDKCMESLGLIQKFNSDGLLDALKNF